MTKADIVTKIADRTGMEKSDVLAVVENFMHEVKTNMEPRRRNRMARQPDSSGLPAHHPRAKGSCMRQSTCHMQNGVKIGFEGEDAINRTRAERRRDRRG